METEPPLEHPLISLSWVALNLPLITGIAAFVLLILVSAVVSGSEVAIFSLDAAKQEKLSERADRASKRVLSLLAKPQQTLITILVLNTMVNVSAAILAAIATEYAAASLPVSKGIVFLLEIVALTFVLLVCSEITPKLIASRHSVIYSRLVSRPIQLAQTLLYPIVKLLAVWAQKTKTGFLRWVPHDTSKKLSTIDVRVMAEIGTDHGTIEPEEQDWINSILDFGNTSARTVMINRMDITALSVGSSLQEALDLIRTSGHSRLPLYIGHMDNILGIIYAKDLLPFLAPDHKDPRVDWHKLMRPPMFVPQNMKLDALLQDFRQKKTHIAIVVDEYGGTAGLVTLEDVLEEVVGDIQDEHDSTKEPFVEDLGKGHYRVDAKIDLDRLNDLLDISLDTRTFDFETLGGLVFHLAGDIPQEGFSTTYEDLAITVHSVENNRVGTVHIRKMHTALP